MRLAILALVVVIASSTQFPGVTWVGAGQPAPPAPTAAAAPLSSL